MEDEQCQRIFRSSASAHPPAASRLWRRSSRRCPRRAAWFVVVMHLDPTHESWLPAIIGRRTSMPVTAARDRERVEPGRIYVLAPGAIMTIAGARLHLRERGAGSGGGRLRGHLFLFSGGGFRGGGRGG